MWSPSISLIELYTFSEKCGLKTLTSDQIECLQEGRTVVYLGACMDVITRGPERRQPDISSLKTYQSHSMVICSARSAEHLLCSRQWAKLAHFLPAFPKVCSAEY